MRPTAAMGQVTSRRVGDPQQVFPKNPADAGGRIAESLEARRDLRNHLGWRESGAAAIAPLPGPDLRPAASGLVELGTLEHVVEADARVFCPDELRDIVDVADDHLGGRRAAAEKKSHAVDPDDAACVRAGLDEFVRNVTGVVSQATRVRVREDYRPVGRIEDLTRRAIAGVRAALDHADAIHFAEDSSPELGETLVLGIVAAAARKVSPVVHEQHPPNADLVEELDERKLRPECLDTLDVEADGKSAARPGGAQVRGREAEQVLVRISLDEVPDARGSADHRLERYEAIADVHRDDIDACIAIARKRREERIDVPQRQACMIVPDEPSAHS